MNKETFQQFLGDKHSDGYIGTDDNMSDDFDKWLIDLQVDELIDYGDEYREQEVLNFWEKMNKEMHKYIDTKILEIEKKSEDSEMLDSEAGFIAGLNFIKKELNQNETTKK